MPPSVPDYNLLRRIGGGAYGDVWLARSTTGLLRAVKVVWRETFEDERPFQREFEGIQRFERLSREHPSQLALFHVGRNAAAGYFYYVMELADDLNTEREVRSAESFADSTASTPRSALDTPHSYIPHTLRADFGHGPLPAARVLELGLALTEALAHLHTNSLVHRDIKPSNIIFVVGKPKLADIGLVTDAGDTRSIVGTEGYLAPEGPGTPQADLFALGKVLYEAVTGLDRRQLPQLPPDLRVWPDAKLVFELNEIILKACAAAPGQRYANAGEMLLDLEFLVAGKSVRSAHQTARRWRLAGRGTAGLAAGAAVVTLMLLAGRLWQSPVVAPVEKLSTNDVANQAYKLGNIYLDKLRGTNFQMAADYFEAAIRADTNFAQAYARLAESYTWSDGQWNPGWKHFPKAKELARKALGLYPSLAEPHGVLGCYHALIEWSWSEAEWECKQGLQMNPSAMRPHVYYAEFLRMVGRTDQALQQMQAASVLDPHSMTINARLAGYLADARRFEEALAQMDQVVASDAHQNMSGFRQDVLCALGRYGDAIESERSSRKPSGRLNLELDALKRAVETAGPKAYWRRELQKAKQLNDPYWQARSHAQLGETDEAIALLQQALSIHDRVFTFRVMTDWALDPVRSDPRFHAILKTMHLE